MTTGGKEMFAMLALVGIQNVVDQHDPDRNLMPCAGINRQAADIQTSGNTLPAAQLQSPLDKRSGNFLA
jgi:hypothetical protein